MKVLLRELTESENALANLAQADLPARLSFTLALVLRAVRPHLDAKRAAHDKLLQKYGTQDPKRAGFYVIPPEQAEAFKAEFDELLSADCELPGIGKIKASTLEAANVKLAAADAAALDWLIVNDVGAFDLFAMES